LKISATVPISTTVPTSHINEWAIQGSCQLWCTLDTINDVLLWVLYYFYILIIVVQEIWTKNLCQLSNGTFMGHNEHIQSWYPWFPCFPPVFICKQS